ncbi:hypothetical protein MTP99_011405 [Tenebrio molitor]|jgi:DNA-directed RNA polymerase I and III subunit RPAC2|uniref:DNA-directed RNA polymerases I and III subunit RPAC2 n=1 Tax=Tenebrio molitor TaxID=7067 RepID=UPI00270A02E4|nr:hypothetical protein MTP99_011405 [Tenebrio molitor]
MPITQIVGNQESSESCRTFILQGEGHTLGNALRWVIAGNPDVEFCAYTVAHPMEATMHLRIQMRKGRAVDALKRGLEDLVSLSDHVLEQFSREKQEFDAMFV